MSEFSTNRFSVKVRQNDCSVASLSSIPDLCFDDGNIAILTGLRYFLVHEDLLRRHSSVLASLVDQLCEETSSEPLEGRPTLILQHQADEMAIFLHALYHGMWDFHLSIGAILTMRLAELPSLTTEMDFGHCLPCSGY